MGYFIGMRTITKELRAADPRAPLCRHLGISPQYANDITKGKAIGGTETLARIAGRLGLDDAEIGASVREMYPEAFTEPERADDHAA